MFTTEEYFQYMSSPEWKAKKEQRIKIDAGRCQMCGSAENLNVHHVTYRTFGRENPWTDLICLCQSCHKNVHVMMCRITGKDENGKPRHGWKSDLPSGIAEALEARGLM